MNGPNKLRHSIAYRLLVAVLLFSLLLTTFSAGFRLYFDYKNALKEINQEFREIETGSLPSIAANLWVMDKEQLQTELNGLLNVAHMKYAKIQFKNQIIVSAGVPGDKDTLNREFPIYYFHDNRKLFIGALYVSAGLNGVYEELRGVLLQIFFYQGLEVFLISLFVFLIFQISVTKHLITIAAYFRQQDPWKSEKQLILEGRAGKGKNMDEIDEVATAINTMSTKMRKNFSELETELLRRKQAEESLAEEKERLAVTLRSIGDGVITTDIEGKIVLINKVTEGLTGWTQEHAAGKPLDQVFHIINELSRERCENPVDKVLQTGMIVELANHTLLISRDGTERVIADSGAPIRDSESKIIGVVLVFRDTTEKENMRKEVLKIQKLESLGILAGGIAHDFNNLLTGVLGNISLAKMLAQPGDKIFERLTGAEKASARAKDLTQQLLTFSRGGAPVKKLTSIADLIKDCAGFVLSGSNVKCKFDIADDLWPAEVDEGQISQVINNLVLNAEQSMPEGGIIDVSCNNVVLGDNDAVQLQKGKYIKIAIKDFGTGIKKEYLQKIFDPFFTTKQSGRGLGLATVYSIINNHNGHITVESEQGIGTVFTFYLPASEPQIILQSGGNRPAPGKGSILVMDDEELVRDVAGQILETLGYEVQLAANGAEAIELFKKARESANPFDVVLMDLTIPGGMGGREAVRELLKIDPGVKAIVSSGYSNDPIMADFKRYGFRGVITKPYKVQELSDTVHGVITGTG
ncbi:MAG: ATP-binding protein [Dissulfurispiraceae bacterium]|jgi:PAS domain S-box-containing protein